MRIYFIGGGENKYLKTDSAHISPLGAPNLTIWRPMYLVLPFNPNLHLISLNLPINLNVKVILKSRHY